MGFLGTATQTHLGSGVRGQDLAMGKTGLYDALKRYMPIVASVATWRKAVRGEGRCIARPAAGSLSTTYYLASSTRFLSRCL